MTTRKGAGGTCAGKKSGTNGIGSDLSGGFGSGSFDPRLERGTGFFSPATNNVSYVCSIARRHARRARFQHILKISNHLTRRILRARCVPIPPQVHIVIIGIVSLRYVTLGRNS